MKKEIMCYPSEKGMLSDKTATTVTKQYLYGENTQAKYHCNDSRDSPDNKTAALFKTANYK